MKITIIALISILALISPRAGFLKHLSFALWVTLFVVISVSYPFLFSSWFGLDLQALIVPLIQVIMFGMGTTLSINDFKRVLRMPVPVLIGMILQYSIMPLVGFGLASAFQFSPPLAAGIILVGCSPGGVASNLMTYIARGNVALSVTMTACSTLISPLMTPYLMEKLAGELIPIPFLAMMLSILNMVIIPVLGGIAAHGILYGKASYNRNTSLLLILACSGFAAAAGAFLIFRGETGQLLQPLRGGLILGPLLFSFTCLLRTVSNQWIKDSASWLDKALPFISMSGICLIIAIISSRSVDQLRTAGILLVTASALHCFLGFSSGYWLGRLAGLNRNDCRTIAFEVGMQNSGMASGLAISVLKNVITALPPAIFGPLMNIAGSIAAYQWGKNPGPDTTAGLHQKPKN